MISATENQGLLLTELPAAAGARATADPKWLATLRADAATHFAELGLPTKRDEEWRLTNLRPLADLKFNAIPDGAATVTAQDVAAFDVAGLDGPQLVFVNGRYSDEHSSIGSLPDGVTVRTFAAALEQDDDLLREHVGALTEIDNDAFAALNTALVEDGVVVHVGRDVSYDQPVRILSITVCDEPIVSHPRNLIVVEDGGRATVIEEYVCLRDDVYLTNALTEIFVGVGADVHHYMIERESPRAFNLSTLKIRQERDSRFTSHSLLLGGAIVRNNVHPVLVGENCHSVLNGLYIGAESQHLDNHMRVEHRVPNCDSRQYYKGVLSGKAQGVFSGRIVVSQDAQKTDAVQRNQNLLLSADARAHVKPQLEIYADDVKCTHGATTGELEDEAIFYLRSRGLDEASAKGLLIYAFAGETFQRMELEPLRESLRTLALEHLPHSAFLSNIT